MKKITIVLIRTSTLTFQVYKIVLLFLLTHMLIYIIQILVLIIRPHEKFEILLKLDPIKSGTRS